MKPILKYRGGKTKEIPQFINLIPEFDTYYEPFIGGGAVFFHLEPENAVINDINESLIKFYNEIKHNFETVRNDLDKLQSQFENNRKIFIQRKETSPHDRVVDPNEEVYYFIRDLFNGKTEGEYSYGAIYYYINKLAYSGMIRYNKSGEYNVPYGRYANFNTKLLTKQHEQLLKNTEIHNKSYEEIFDLVNKDDFVFLDPPYDTKFSDYGNEVFTGDFDEDNHRTLAENFKNLNGKTMMIIGETGLTKELYSKYIYGSYPKNYAVNIRNRFKSNGNHLIVSNYLK